MAGKMTKLKQYDLKLKLFRLTAHSGCTDYVITNDHKAIGTSNDATEACAVRWKIEQYHRDSKQLTGTAKCQARTSKARRKHIIIAILAWTVLHAQAQVKQLSIYALKNEPVKQFQALL